MYIKYVLFSLLAHIRTGNCLHVLSYIHRVVSIYFNVLYVYMCMFILSVITRAREGKRARVRERARAFQTTIFAISRKCVFSQGFFLNLI